MKNFFGIFLVLSMIVVHPAFAQKGLSQLPTCQIKVTIQQIKKQNGMLVSREAPKPSDRLTIEAKILSSQTDNGDACSSFPVGNKLQLESSNPLSPLQSGQDVELTVKQSASYSSGDSYEIVGLSVLNSDGSKESLVDTTLKLFVDK